ncbi:MAG: sugar transferase [Bacteroidia bacterium]|nr:sugar transferase [Bacteroidia bacterium]
MMRPIYSRLFNISFLLITFLISISAATPIIIPKHDSELLWKILPISLVALSFAILLTEADKPKLYQRKIKYIIAPYVKLVFLTGFIFALVSIPFISLTCHFWYLLLSHILSSAIVVVLYFVGLYLLLKLNYFKITISSSVTKYNQEKLTPDILNEGPDELVYIFGDPDCFSEYSGLSEIISSKLKRFHLENIESINQKEIKINLLLIGRVLNELGDLNKLLSSAHSVIRNGGDVVVIYKELKTFESEFIISKITFLKKLKKVFFIIRYRLLPKIPYLNFLTSGRVSALSKAEIWGRLAYAGFDVKKDVSHSGLRYVFARKEFQISDNPSPSFYPIIALNRVGLYGQIIKIHKIRSMSPYSEFIQKKVHDENQLSGTGKFVNDFRITDFGAFFRRYWIDELPQLYDWFRGEIKLVGIRALSQHYFSLYSREYQEKFILVKPGIISPIFDEETDGFDEIVRIETEYLDSYLKNPVWTDIKYFFITLRQILSGVRSK